MILDPKINKFKPTNLLLAISIYKPLTSINIYEVSFFYELWTTIDFSIIWLFLSTISINYRSSIILSIDNFYQRDLNGLCTPMGSCGEPAPRHKGPREGHPRDFLSAQKWLMLGLVDVRGSLEWLLKNVRWLVFHNRSRVVDHSWFTMKRD